ncbi:MAG TPA: alpha/beta hydrolase [Nocardioidaceae bacterium]|nr:alpha/beta hydrolase [Nocardioidaceae bacterium]
MTTFVLVPGAGGQASHWLWVAPLLEAAGHQAVAVELPAGDESAGLAAYTGAIVAAARAANTEPGCVVVAQSMGGFSAPQACADLGAARLVLVNAMIPAPGETAGDWWAATGQSAAYAAKAATDGRDLDAEFDPVAVFFNGVAPEILAAAMAMPEPVQADRPFADPWPLAAWPDVRTEVLSSTDDRMFPLDFQRRVAEDRLGITPVVLPGGHLPAFACPSELAERLLAS